MAYEYSSFDHESCDWNPCELHIKKDIEIDYIDDKHGERWVVMVDGQIKKIFKNKVKAIKFSKGVK